MKALFRFPTNSLAMQFRAVREYFSLQLFESYKHAIHQKDSFNHLYQ